jgi:hypothetical protein
MIDDRLALAELLEKTAIVCEAWRRRCCKC